MSIYVNLSPELQKDLVKASASKNILESEQLEQWVRLGMLLEKQLSDQDLDIFLKGKAGLQVEPN